MLWLVPFYAVLTGRQALRQQAVFTAVCFLTTAIYPYCFTHLDAYFPILYFLLNIRNALLVWLYWMAVQPEHTNGIDAPNQQLLQT